MEILTDADSKAAAFFGRAPSEMTAGGRPLSQAERRLAGFFFGSRPARMLRIDDPPFPPRFNLLILQESAPISNLDLMTDLQRQGFLFPDGLLCAALSGERFLGRYDRSWQCRPGNVHAVIPLRPRLTLEQAGAAFSILGAVACADAIRRSRGLEGPGGPKGPGGPGGPVAGRLPARNMPRIKWVNDVYAGRRKIAGMLTRQSFQEPHITDVCLGIGVNVLDDPVLPGDAFVPATSCLAKEYADTSWSPGQFLAALAHRIDAWYGLLLAEGPAPLLDFYRENCNFMGRRVRIYEDGYGFGAVAPGGRRLLARGVVEAVLDDLSLKIAGTPGFISAGRLAFEQDCGDDGTSGETGC